MPAGHHDELAQVIDDARAAVPLRDDNGLITGAWPRDLLRRAMLEAVRRLGADAPDHAVEATVDDLVARLGGADEPANAELAGRAVDRARRSTWTVVIDPRAATVRPERVSSTG